MELDKATENNRTLLQLFFLISSNSNRRFSEIRLKRNHATSFSNQFGREHCKKTDIRTDIDNGHARLDLFSYKRSYMRLISFFV